VKMVNDLYVPTREELEKVLDDMGFRPSSTSGDVWIYADGTKFVLFNEKGDQEGVAVFGDSDHHEPGRPLNYRQIHAAATGVLALDAPELRKIPLLGPPIWASGPTPGDTKMLPARASDVVEGEIVEDAPEAEAEPVMTGTAGESSRVKVAVARPWPPPEPKRWRDWVLPVVISVAIVLVLTVGTLLVVFGVLR
jgi:hypothetical protein